MKQVWKMEKTYKFNLERDELLYIREELNPEVTEGFMLINGFINIDEKYMKTTHEFFGKIMYYLYKRADFKLKSKLQRQFDEQY